MTIPKVTEAESIIVDKFYLVPCILVDKRGFQGFKEGQYLPVLLPFHNDTEIGFETWHYHYDHRFINPKKQIHRGIVVGRELRDDPTNKTNTFDKTIYWRKRKCLDPNAGYPTVPPLSKLESTKSLKMCGLVCPHKGTQLNGIEIIDGAIKCPAHGLRFCATTGAIQL